MKILIGIPCIDKAPIEFTECLVNMRLDVPHEYAFRKGALVFEARDSIVRQAINEGFTHVMFIDSDIMFEPDDVQRLVNQKVNIIGGLYYSKNAALNPMCWTLESVNGRLRGDYFTPPRRYMPVDALGMGFTLIKTKVFEQIAVDHGKVFYPDYMAGEDIAFCHRAKLSGYDIICDSGLNLKHIGAYAYGR